MKKITIEAERYKETEIKIEWLMHRWVPIYIGVNLAETINRNEARLTASFRQLTNKAYGDTRYVIAFYNEYQDDVLHQIMWVDHLLGYAYTTENLVNSLIKAGFSKEKVVNYVLSDIENLKAFDIASAFSIAKKNLSVDKTSDEVAGFIKNSILNGDNLVDTLNLDNGFAIIKI